MSNPGSIIVIDTLVQANAQTYPLVNAKDVGGDSSANVLLAATFPAFSGDVTKAAGSLATTVTAIQNKGITLATGFLKYNGSAFAFDNSTYLTSLSGAVLTDQTAGQTIGATGARLTKLWATDITVTNAISGGVTGNAGTVTGATFTTALTVNTGTVTLTGNAANTSALTIGAGAVSVSGTNTGDNAANSSTMYIGTTAHALNRASATETLTGIQLTSPNINEAVALTTTATKLNYLTSATGTAGTASGKVVFDTAPTFVTSLTTPAVLATANDSGALGASGTAFSDLFLASGGVINWNAGNATLTHSAGLLTSNVALSLGTSNALTCGSIELGAASDTTITRTGAGAIAVEGAAVLLSGGALGTPSSGTVTNLTGTASININGTVGATTPTTIVGTTIQANTGIVPDANDGAYLGTPALQFSDLFLAEGGVINWDNGDATLTQAGNVVTLDGASFISTGSITASNSDFGATDGALQALGQNPTFVQTLSRASGGYNCSLFKNYATNTTTSLTSLSANIGVFGNLQSGITPPSITYLYFGVGPTAAYDNPVMVLLPSGYTGIGTTTPFCLLDVVGGASGATSVLANLRSNGFGNNTGTTLRLTNSTSDDSVANAEITALRTNTTSSYTDLIFSAYGAITERMRLVSNGRVGIATSAPLRGLDINEASGNCLRLIYNDSNGSATNYADFLVSSGGNLTLTTSGTDLTVTNNLLVNGNTTLGNASTDTVTHTGRMIVRTTASDPKHATAGSRPAGSVGEIAYYSGKMYFCTNAATPTWELITSA